MARWLFFQSASTFVPSDVSGMTLWLSADSNVFTDTARTTPATNDGDTIGGWGDQSGVAHHFSQSTSGSRPTLKLNIQNSKPVIRFDGTDDLMTNSAQVGTFIVNTAYTYFIVWKATAINTNGATTDQNDSIICDTGGYFGMFLKSAPTQWVYNWDGTSDSATTSIATGSFMVSMGRHETGNLYSSVNGGSETSTASGNTQVTTGTMKIGNDRLGSNFLDGDIAEMIVYNVAVSTTNISNVITYLRTKYGI